MTTPAGSTPEATPAITAGTASAEAVVAQAQRLGLVWELRLATVISPSPDGASALGTYDNDVKPIPMISMVGVVASGARVYVISVPPQGNYIVGFAQSWPSRILARGNRITSSPGSTGVEVGVLRIDNISVLAASILTIYTSPLIFNSTVANDLIEIFVRYSTTGQATTSSTKVSSIVMSARSAAGSQFVLPFICDLPITAGGVISVLLSVQRAAGTGTVNIVGSALYPIDLVIVGNGPDPGNTGVSL